MENTNNNPLHKDKCKDTKSDYATQLYSVLFSTPMSRRMAATEIGFIDQTYMVTQFVNDWIKQGKAQVIGSIKCKRSNRLVESVTTNPELFREKDNNQLKMF